jgi:hypothetical protein
MPKDMPKVTIIGAGISGLSAGLRLAERGYEVTIFERDQFVGGKFRATEWIGKDTTQRAFHEHSYHMFLNWYHNFFEIAEDIGTKDNFIPLKRVKFLYEGHFPQMKELVNFGSAASIPQNLLSGILSIPDMFLYMYSVLDLLGTPMTQNRFRDLITVNAFASTKPYATEASVGMYDEYLAKTFAIASYLTSAKSFQTFLEYNSYVPDPLYWAITGDCFTRFLHPLQSKLERLGVKIILGREVKSFTLGADGNIAGVNFLKHERYSRSLSEFDWKDVGLAAEGETYEIQGPLILAVPPAVLSDLFGPDTLNRSPELGECAKLQSVPMTSVHLHLNDKFAKRLRAAGAKLPREPVVLVNSNYKLSFVANSRLWPESPETYLNIVASDSRPLGNLLAPPMFTYDREWKTSGPGLALEAPVTTLDHILHEFRRFVPFEQDEIDMELLQIDRNAGRELFINEVGSWKWRPETRTKVRNLFLAGDFCKNPIDVVCLEGAVVSGLQAAECVRKQYGVGAPIKIVSPKKYPYSFFWLLKCLLAPYAVGAKAWSTCDGLVKKSDE